MQLSATGTVALLTREGRLAVARRAFGSWKHRSLKKDLQILTKIRRGWDRRIV